MDSPSDNDKSPVEETTHSSGSGQTDVEVASTHNITVTSGSFKAEIQVKLELSADGRTLNYTAVQYWANRSMYTAWGYLFVRFQSGGGWSSGINLEEVNINSQWTSINRGGSIASNGVNAKVEFRFLWRMAGGSGNPVDVITSPTFDLVTTPPTPSINPLKNFTASTFNVTGTGAIARANMVLLDSEGRTLAQQVQPTAGAWSVSLTVEDSKNDQNIQAYQVVNGRPSARTGYISAYRAKLTSPTNNSIMPAKDFKFTGTAAPDTSVRVVQGISGVEWSDRVNTAGGSTWQASPKSAFSGSGEKYITAELDSAQNYTAHITFRYLDYPGITSHGDNSEQEQTFTVSGNNRLANAEVKVFIDGTTTSPVGIAPVGASATWSAAVTLQPGLRRVAAEQFLLGKESGRKGSVLFKIRPAKPVLQSRSKGEGIEFYGTGYATGRMHIHVSGDGVNSIDVDIPQSGNYTKELPATVVPGSYKYVGRQSVSDGGTGRIYNLGWASEIWVAVPTPRPTSVSVTRNGNKLTITGRGNTWGTIKGSAIIHKNGQDFRPKFPNGDVQSDLTWRTTSVDLDPGTYIDLSVKQWVNGVYSAEVAVPVISIPPSSPTYTAPAPNAQTNQTPTITGRAWTNSDVLLTIPPRPAVPLKATGTAGTIGSFSYPVTDPLPPKTYIISAISAMGGETSTASTLTFTVQPPLPEPTTTGEVSTDVVIEGKGWPHCWVEILSATHVTLGSGPVNEDETWKIGIGKLAPGPLTFYCRQKETQTSNNVSGPTANQTVTVAVPRAAFTVPEPNGHPPRKSTFSGITSATYGSVELSIKGSAPFITGVLVDDGKWTTPVELEAGLKTLEARVFQDGYRSNPTEITFTVVPNAPLLDTPLNTENVGKMVRVSGHGLAGDSVTVQRVGSPYNFQPVLVNPDNTWSGLFGHNMIATDKIAAVARVGTGPYSQQSAQISPTLLSPPIDITEPRAGDWVGPLTEYAGRAAPHAFIAVAAWYDTGVLLTPSTQADKYGYWRVLGNRDLPDGLARVQVRQTLDGVNSEWRMSDAFTVQRITEIDWPVAEFPAPGQTVGLQPMFSGWGLPGALITVSQTSGPVLMTARVHRDGHWEGQSTVSIAPRDLSYSVKQQRDGKDSGYRQPARNCKVIQVQAGFAKPIIDLPLNNPEQVLETKPLFEGRGFAGALLTVYRHATEEILAETRVDARGYWSVRCPVELEVKPEPHEISVRQHMDGQDSAWSGIITQFKVGTALSPPVAVDPAEGARVSRNPVITLTAIPGETVSLFKSQSTTKIGTGVVDESGRCLIVLYGLPVDEFKFSGRVEKANVVSGWMANRTVFVEDFG